MTDQMYFTPTEVAELCGVSYRCVDAWCRSGCSGIKLGFYWAGGRRRILFSALQEFRRKVEQKQVGDVGELHDFVRRLEFALEAEQRCQAS